MQIFIALLIFLTLYFHQIGICIDEPADVEVFNNQNYERFRKNLFIFLKNRRYPSEPEEVIIPENDEDLRKEIFKIITDIMFLEDFELMEELLQFLKSSLSSSTEDEVADIPETFVEVVQNVFPLLKRILSPFPFDFELLEKFYNEQYPSGLISHKLMGFDENGLWTMDRFIIFMRNIFFIRSIVLDSGNFFKYSSSFPDRETCVIEDDIIAMLNNLDKLEIVTFLTFEGNSVAEEERVLECLNSNGIATKKIIIFPYTYDESVKYDESIGKNYSPRKHFALQDPIRHRKPFNYFEILKDRISKTTKSYELYFYSYINALMEIEKMHGNVFSKKDTICIMSNKYNADAAYQYGCNVFFSEEERTRDTKLTHFNFRKFKERMRDTKLTHFNFRKFKFYVLDGETIKDLESDYFMERERRVDAFLFKHKDSNKKLLSFNFIGTMIPSNLKEIKVVDRCFLVYDALSAIKSAKRFLIKVAIIGPKIEELKRLSMENVRKIFFLHGHAQRIVIQVEQAIEISDWSKMVEIIVMAYLIPCGISREDIFAFAPSSSIMGIYEMDGNISLLKIEKEYKRLAENKLSDYSNDSNLAPNRKSILYIGGNYEDMHLVLEKGFSLAYHDGKSEFKLESLRL